MDADNSARSRWARLVGSTRSWPHECINFLSRPWQLAKLDWLTCGYSGEVWTLPVTSRLLSSGPVNFAERITSRGA